MSVCLSLSSQWNYVLFFPFFSGKKKIDSMSVSLSLSLSLSIYLSISASPPLSFSLSSQWDYVLFFPFYLR